MTTNITEPTDFNPDEPDSEFEGTPDVANELLLRDSGVVAEQTSLTPAAGFGLDLAAIENFQKSLQSNLPVVKEFPSWLIKTFPTETQLFTYNSRLDVYVRRVWLMSCWFNKIQGLFIHLRDQGAKIYNQLETSLHPKAELGHGNYNGEQTIRFYVKVEKDFDRLKDLTAKTINKYTSLLADLPANPTDIGDSAVSDQHKLMFLTGWWRRLNEIRENSSTSPAILARDSFTRAGYKGYQDYSSKFNKTVEEKNAKAIYYQAYLDFQYSGGSGDWLKGINFKTNKLPFDPGSLSNLVKAFKVKFGDFSSPKYMTEERTPKLKEIEKLKRP